jgi:hypothetical protein
LTLLLYVGVLGLFVVVVSEVLRSPEGGGLGFGARVAVVELDGIILDVDDIVRDLKSHRDNPLVPGTLTGSIGVIMQMANLENLMKKVGVEYVVIKSGQFKDVGNISRPMTAEERRVLQSLLDDVHRQFIDAVAEGRHLDRAKVVGFADGRVFSGAQAKALGMVDELGGLEEAVNAAAKLAGLPIPARVIPPRRRFSVMDLLRSQLGLGKATPFLPALPAFKTPLYLLD